MFITLEGIEGVGKTTQVQFVAASLRRYGHEVVVTREPGGTALGESIRGVLLAGRPVDIDSVSELLLMFAARAAHLHSVVRPSLSAGKSVVCDRFTDASYAYQGGGRSVAEEKIAVLEDLVQAGLQPDLTLLLDAPVALALARTRQRGEAPDRFESEQSEFFERVRHAYQSRAQREPQRIQIIDASKDIAEVSAQIEHVISTHLGSAHP